MSKLCLTDRTPREALHDLLGAPRLRFGDVSQIDALLILRLAEALVEQPRKCPYCDGLGEGDFEDCDACDGTGETTWSRDVVYALRVSNIVEHLTPEVLKKVA